MVGRVLLTALDILDVKLRRPCPAPTKPAQSVMMVVVGAGIILTGVGFMSAAAVIALSAALGPALGTLLTGGGLMAVGLVVWLIARLSGPRV